ncbi:GNAT family N-acetyltransferase [Streptomyces sp. NBC_00237]|uniref:GNAT family N-acetyltransferase n=1 Tax=Streptomyces sp. NBC_00237 TaxID=2975687 RepID=UPI00224D2D01|nr:GNAT family N-acetyltransferase [Streptomyces sp. NBC_00237]MCX5204255.1 GNAT family N-acetyltransferase [Streptomyces sp. NBC_00237]
MAFATTTDAVRAWAEGWALSRGTADPVPQPWGVTIDIGLPKAVTRHVLFDGYASDEATVRKLVRADAAPGTWVKFVEPPETVAPWMAEGWEYDAAGHLMSLALTPEATAPEVPTGYTRRSWTRAGLTRVVVLAADGSLGVRGQVAVTGRTAVVDQVETNPVHQRRGLGTLMMRTLQAYAAEQGAQDCVLGATDDGLALYATLGWQRHSALTGVFRT